VGDGIPGGDDLFRPGELEVRMPPLEDLGEISHARVSEGDDVVAYYTVSCRVSYERTDISRPMSHPAVT
jgi:hypothetical protein